MISFVRQFDYNIAHIVPDGTPGILIPFMVLIETVRVLIRPFTLAFRLGANMVAGHLLIRLLGNSFDINSLRLITVLIVILIALMTLELAVAVIQSYVFCLLSALYAKDHLTSKFVNLNFL